MSVCADPMGLTISYRPPGAFHRHVKFLAGQWYTPLGHAEVGAVTADCCDPVVAKVCASGKRTADQFGRATSRLG